MPYLIRDKHQMREGFVVVDKRGKATNKFVVRSRMGLVVRVE